MSKKRIPSKENNTMPFREYLKAKVKSSKKDAV